MDQPDPTPPALPTTDQGPRRGLLWGLGGGLLASLCCAGPLVAVLIGVGGATGAVGLVRFKWWFLAVGFAVTLVGIGLALRRTKVRCSVQTYRRNRILLPVAGVLTFLVLALGSQYLLLNDRVIETASSRLSDQSGNDRETASIAAPSVRQLDVAVTSGVDCAACLLAIQQELTETPGVTSAAFVKVPEAKYTVRVIYDPARVSQTTLLTTIVHAPGALGGTYGTKVLRDAPAA
jgi:hypothetical protein